MGFNMWMMMMISQLLIVERVVLTVARSTWKIIPTFIESGERNWGLTNRLFFATYDPWIHVKDTNHT
jgi:hypothetical protein